MSLEKRKLRTLGANSLFLLCLKVDFDEEGGKFLYLFSRIRMAENVNSAEFSEKGLGKKKNEKVGCAGEKFKIGDFLCTDRPSKWDDPKRSFLFIGDHKGENMQLPIRRQICLQWSTLIPVNG